MQHESPAAFNRILKNPERFVGRGFSRDIKPTK
jgi:hypothetical protein